MSVPDRTLEEINRILDQKAERGDEWVPRWVAQQVCQNHESGLSDTDDADFWRHHGYRQVREQVRRVISSRTDPTVESDAPQLTFEGYDHLQQYYSIERDGDQIGVPTLEMSDDELQEKAAEYRKQADALYAHADEIERFIRDRQNGEAAGWL